MVIFRKLNRTMTKLAIKITDKNNQESDFILENPILKGYNGVNIKSKIKDLIKVLPTSKLLKSDDPNVKKIIELSQQQTQLKDKKDKESIDKLESINLQIQELSMSNIDLLYDIQGGYNNESVKIMFELLQMILEYYQKNLFSCDDFSEDEIYRIINWICKEPKNNLENFLAQIPATQAEEEKSKSIIKD